MNDLKFAIRRLLNNPGFTVIAVLTLAVGLALTAATLATVNAYLLRSLPYPTAERVYHLRYAPVGPYEPRGMNAIDWKALQDVVEDPITASGVNFYLRSEGSLMRARGLQISSGFIRGLGIRPTLGRTFAEEEFRPGAENVAMISFELWRDRFGSDPRTIGRVLDLNREDEQAETVRLIGVLPPAFWFGRDSSAKVDLLTPLRFLMRPYMVRLRAGVPVALAEKRITEAARTVGSDFRPDWKGVELESVHQRYVESIKPVLVAITIAVSLVLLLVCANIGVLMLLRGMRRQKELAVRLALGAGRSAIVRLLATEAALICAAAFAGAVALTTVTLNFLAPRIEAQLGKPAPAGPSAIQLDSSVLLALGGLSAVIAFSLALIPVLPSRQGRFFDFLRSQSASTTDSPAMKRLRGSLVALETAGSLVLLFTCGLMVRSALNLTRTDLGFNPEQVLRVGVRLPAPLGTNRTALHQFFTALTERLSHDPDAELALMTAFPPFYPANKYRFETGQPGRNLSSAGMLPVGPGYFGLYYVPLKQGREFTAADRVGADPVAVISQTLRHTLWPDGDAIGQQIRVVEGDTPDSPLGPWRTIVGVVGDIRQGYDDSDLRDIYLPFLQVPSRFASVHIRTRRSLPFWDKSVRTAATELEPRVYVSPATTILSEDRQRAGTQFIASILSGFALFATLLATLGIYSVTAYAVQQREREVAIRNAVGASKRAIISLFLKQGGQILIIGLAFGLVGVFSAAKILKNRLYEVEPFDFATILFTCLLIGLIGLFAVWWPARRAAARNPMSVLKEG